jgi:Protein of unknown function (DUF2934)
MPTTRVTTPRRTGRKPPVPVVPEASKPKSGVISGLVAQPAAKPAIDPQTQYTMIAEAAYYCAEKRGFTPGGELADWLAAEAQIRELLAT